ncbi:MAG TPA: hypothetical protein VEC12_12545 [Bacteroidia bacterium]|nr:hypothetical protein [Bacteroidia bacterium]
MPNLFRIVLLLLPLWFCLPAAAQTATQQAADSTVIIYHDNGKVKEKGVLKNGLKDGRWREYDTNGDLVKMTRYKNGEFRWERLYKEGKIIQITNRKGKVRKMKNCGC